MEELRPNQNELIFLNLAYNRFYDIFNEVFEDEFWKKEPFYRLAVIKDAFSIYSELLCYEPIIWTIDEMRIKRPPMEAEIAKDLFKFLRNVVNHFPFFNSWNEIWISEQLINWSKKDQTIDRFIKKNVNTGIIKYRIWEEKIKKMTYFSISYPNVYKDNKIFIKDIISEYEGIKFSLILMKNIINSQVEEINKNG